MRADCRSGTAAAASAALTSDLSSLLCRFLSFLFTAALLVFAALAITSTSTAAEARPNCAKNSLLRRILSRRRCSYSESSCTTGTGAAAGATAAVLLIAVAATKTVSALSYPMLVVRALLLVVMLTSSPATDCDTFCGGGALA